MRLAYFLLGLFLIIISVRTHSRELKPTEKAALLLKQRTVDIRDFMAEKVDEDALSFADFMLFQAAKKGCLPLEKLEEKIQNGPVDLPDQTAKIMPMYQLCSEATLTLTHFYTKQN